MVTYLEKDDKLLKRSIFLGALHELRNILINIKNANYMKDIKRKRTILFKKSYNKKSILLGAL